MQKVSSRRYEFIFKRAFCDVDVFKGFVRDFLGIELKIDKIQTEKSLTRPSVMSILVLIYTQKTLKTA